MAITIGRLLENDYSNPIGMLSDCHRRIEKFLRVLRTITNQVQNGIMPAEHRDAFAVALRYFREGAPKHMRDEEDSLFPRLRQSMDAQAQAVMMVLDALHQDHLVADAWHREVEVLGSRWLSQSYLLPEDLRALASVLERLSVIYQQHIAIEDTRVFPVAGRVLAQDEVRMLAQEMAARRGLLLDEQLLPSRQTPNRLTYRA